MEYRPLVVARSNVGEIWREMEREGVDVDATVHPRLARLVIPPESLLIVRPGVTITRGRSTPSKNQKKDRSVGRLVGRLVGRSVGRSVGR